jgi:orotidine-5'-phosphate decarboxylase
LKYATRVYLNGQQTGKTCLTDGFCGSIQEKPVLDSFGKRLAEAVIRRRNPVVVGLDPRRDSLPEELRPSPDDGPTAVAQAYLEFCKGVIDVVAPLVPAVKPQSAFFEQLGPAGISVLAEILRYARAKELLVILDAKRNDIGSTAEAYADAYLGPDPLRPLAADALTVSPYLGDDSLRPFLRVAMERGAGIFILVKTSNPGGGQFQDLLSGEKKVYEHVAEFVERLATESCQGQLYGSAGAVVGATYRKELEQLRRQMPHAWLLVPGYGSQGATAEDTAPAFDERGLGAVINNSRGIIFAHARAPYSERFGQRRWQEAVEAATRDMIDQLRAKTRVGRL